MKDNIRIGLLGCGTIGSFVLDALVEGKIPGAQAAVVCVRSEQSKGVSHARQLGIPVITDPTKFLDYHLDIVAENASHEAVIQYGEMLLKAGIHLIPMSLGALVDGDLLHRLIQTAQQAGSQLVIPSGGIGGLDAIQGAMVSGIDQVTMITRKPPVAWKGIPYVQEMGWDLDHMEQPTLLFDGPARDCVRKFPQNINIAAALSLASLGFDRTMIQIYADPTVSLNTHQIVCRGPNGRMSFLFENTPVAANPKTTYQACTSVVATLRRLTQSYRIGT
ncbi:MAG TPA: aspartate dehydrogenase [Firmicutes bacterium]|nr:aspartate dehydrogenase [Bacillota bacterium]